MIKLSTIYKFFNALVGVLIVYFSINFFQGLNFDNFFLISDTTNFNFLLLGFMLYLISHIFRSIRLMIMFSEKNLSLKKIINIQFTSNGINLLLPFKIGEIYRISLFARECSDSSKALYVIICERLIDLFLLIFLLFTILLVLNYSSVGYPELTNIFKLSLILILISLLLIFVLPENIKELRLIFAKHFSGNITLYILEGLKNIDKSLGDLLKILRDGRTTLFTLTSIIWLCEISVFFIFYSIIGDVYLMVFLALLVFLSSMLPAGPLGYGGIQLAFFMVGDIIQNQNLVLYSYVYQIFIFAPAVILSAYLYLRGLIKSVK